LFTLHVVFVFVNSIVNEASHSSIRGPVIVQW
jgi:hypothetical protein